MTYDEEDSLYVCLCLIGFKCPHEDISKCLSLKPDRIEEIGKIAPGTKVRIAKDNAWEFYSKLEKTNLRLKDHINNIFTSIPDLGLIKHIEKDIFINCVPEVYKKKPDLSLDKETIKKLAKWGCALDIDSYWFGSSDLI